MFKSQRILRLLIVSALSGCAAHYPPPMPGQTIAEVAAAQKRPAKRPLFLFLAETHRFAVYGVAADGALDTDATKSSSTLVFEDERYLGALSVGDALGYPACLGQPGGTGLLAQRLRALTAGEPDPLAQLMPDGVSHVGEVQCPSAPAVASTEAEKPSTTEAIAEALESARTGHWAEGREPSLLWGALGAAGGFLTDAVGETVGELVFIITGPVWLPTTAVMAMHEAMSVAAQEKIELNMDGTEAENVMGQPTETLYLDLTHTEVRHFARWMAPALWIGLDGGRVVWLRFGHDDDPWFTHVKKRLPKAQEGSP